MLADKVIGMSNIGEFFVWYRDKREISQRDLAKKLKTYYPHIAQVESGFVKIPKSLIKKLYHLLDSDEQERLLRAIKSDTIDDLNQFLSSLE